MKHYRSPCLAMICAALAFAAGLRCMAEPALQGLLDSYTVSRYGREEGMPELAVPFMEQMPDGFIWCLTPNHLLRFDGVEFKSFGGLHSGVVQKPYPVLYHGWMHAADGTAWVYGRRGAARRTEAGWQRLDPKQGWQSVITMWVDKNRDLRAVTEVGVWRIVDDQLVARLIPSKPELLSRILCAASDDDGSILLGCDSGLVRLEGDIYSPVIPTDIGEIHEVSRLRRGRSGDWWICCREGLLRERKGTWERMELPFPHDQVAVMLEDADGGLWVGTKQGLFYYRDGSWSCLRPQDVASSLEVLSLIQDREKRIWVGTSDGLLGLRPKLVDVYFSDPRERGQAISSLAVDEGGTLWVGSWSSGLFQMRDNELVRAEDFKLPGGVPITALSPSAGGGLWVGTLGSGLLHYHGNKIESFGGGSNNLQSPKEISLVLTVGADDVWAGSTQGLFKMKDSDEGATVLEPASLSEERSVGNRLINRVTALSAGSDGSMWAGYEALGVLKFDPTLQRWLYGYTWGLPDPNVRTLYRDKSGRLWAGTQNGLAVLADAKVLKMLEENHLFVADMGQRSLNRDKWMKTAGQKMLWQSMDESQGLVNQDIRQIIEDDQGRMWLGTRKGLQVFDRQDLLAVMNGERQSAEGRVIGANEGMANEECSLNSSPGVVHSRDGRLWFATTDGLVRVNPAIVQPPENLPAVYLEKVSAGNRSLYDRRENSPLVRVEPVARQTGEILELSPELRDLQFSFTTPVYDAPERTQFRWRLEGGDSDWSAPSPDRQVRYPRLQPGEYAFRVMAGGQGAWREVAAPFRFSIQPHLHERPLVRTAFGLTLAALLVMGVHLMERRRARRRIQRLKRETSLERERSRISRDLHDEMGVGLTEIGLLGDLAGADAFVQEDRKELAGEISARARGLVASLDEIVWAINPANDNALSLGDYFSRYAQTLLQRARVRCRLEVTNNSLDSSINAELRHHLFLAFKEALNNIITHARASEVHIRIGEDNGVLLIQLTDDGLGFEHTEGEGSPDGMRGMRERLANIGGSFQIESTEGGGTKVTFSLPVERTLKP